MSLIEDLRKLRARTRAERRLLLEAFGLLCLMRGVVLLAPFQRIVGFLGLTRGEAPAAFLSPLQTTVSTSIGWAVRAAAARLPWSGTCLAQALAGIIMLQRRGIPGVLYLGVAKDLSTSEPMSAHAWLKSGEVILTGGCGHERFSVISTFVGKGGG